MKKRLECKIYGRVQMVMFRDFVQRKAKKLGLSGVVKNTDDGCVFVVAEGEEEGLEILLKLLYKGPILAKVKHIEKQWNELMNEFSKFEIKYE